jgi:uncharacterized SAM-binding protein YcdF (DUF218 family)
MSEWVELRRAVTFLISPLGTALLLAVLAQLLRLANAWAQGPSVRQRPSVAWLGAAWPARVASACLWLAVLWLLIWSTPWASHALRNHLEQGYPPIAVENVPSAPALVVLGGGISPASLDAPAGLQHPNLQAAADRVWHAARLFHAGKAPLIVVSGGGDLALQRETEAQAMARFLRDLGVPAAALLLEDKSRNTQDNAAMSAALLKARGIQRILLVTSALHMPRAVPLFQAQGLEVIAAAADHEADDTSRWPLFRRLLPDLEALSASGRAIKEWVGRRLLAAS